MQFFRIYTSYRYYGLWVWYNYCTYRLSELSDQKRHFIGGNRVDRFIGRDYRRHYHQRPRFEWWTANQLKSKFRCEPVFDSSGKVIGARSVYDHLRFQEICGGGCSTDSVANYMGSTTASVSSGKCGAKVTFLLLTSDWRVVLSNQNRCEVNSFFRMATMLETLYHFQNAISTATQASFSYIWYVTYLVLYLERRKSRKTLAQVNEIEVWKMFRNFFAARIKSFELHTILCNWKTYNFRREKVPENVFFSDFDLIDLDRNSSVFS